MTVEDLRGPRAYRALLRLLPGRFREVHGRELERLFRDMRAEWEDVHGGTGPRFWMSIGWDTCRVAASEWLTLSRKTMRSMTSKAAWVAILLIFAGSEFGGTVSLGGLTSTTLMLAMITNLILLPSLIMTFDDGKRRINSHPIIENYDSEFYHEHEDEEIDVGKLEIGTKFNPENSEEEK